VSDQKARVPLPLSQKARIGSESLFSCPLDRAGGRATPSVLSLLSKVVLVTGVSLEVLDHWLDKQQPRPRL
jgi:hypothetical protein